MTGKLIFECNKGLKHNMLDPRGYAQFSFNEKLYDFHESLDDEIENGKDDETIAFEICNSSYPIEDVIEKQKRYNFDTFWQQAEYYVVQEIKKFKIEKNNNCKNYLKNLNLNSTIEDVDLYFLIDFIINIEYGKYQNDDLKEIKSLEQKCKQIVKKYAQNNKFKSLEDLQYAFYSITNMGLLDDNSKKANVKNILQNNFNGIHGWMS